MSFDPIALIERAYEPRGDVPAWLKANATEIIAPFDTEGNGTVSYLLRDLRPESIEWKPGPRSRIGRDQAIGSLQTGLAHLSPARVRQGLLAMQQPGAHSFVETFGGMVQPALEHFDHPIGDSPAVIVPTGGSLVAVVATLTSRPISISPEERALWERIAVHLGAACRLSVRPADPAAPDVEAVLDPAGTVLEARGRAKAQGSRERLRDAALRMDRARTRRGRSDPLRALDLWQGLLAGRWSLVDHVEAGGRRLLLVRRNDPDVREPAALSLRQRQVLFYASVGWSLKQIEYALGLARGTITHHLRTALRKVGMPSRAELIRVTTEMMMKAMAPASGTPAVEDDDLTAAEREIVERVVAGWSNERIAESRGVSTSTVANQLTSVYRKVGVQGRHELVRWASSRFDG